MKCPHCDKEISTQRTLSQNNALHRFFKLLSDELNTKGLDMKTVLRESYEAWWTPEAVKEHIWRPFQKVKYGTKSTTLLKKQEQIEEVHNDLMYRLGEKFGVEYIDFPHKCKECNHIDCVCGS